MNIKVETEEKYYCLNPKKMIEIVEELGFTLKNSMFESDEYFTDINSEFIENRTCLRIRKTNNEKMEITFKGKSSSLLGQYCKLENNINAHIEEYENFVKLFSSLGFYSYVIVEKDRMTFEKKDGKYNYSVMIDKLPNIGGFVEFEILANQEDAKKEELSIALRKFISNFSSLKLKEETRPYRDVVANNIYSKYSTKNKLENIYINVDDSLINYEKDFFKKYKTQISKEAGYNVKWGCFKKNKNLNHILIKYVDEYLENLIFDSKELLVSTKLLEKLNYTKNYITKLNEIFFTHFFAKLNIKLSDTIYMNEENISQIIKKNSINLNNSIILNTKDLKEVISILLIIDNNE